MLSPDTHAASAAARRSYRGFKGPILVNRLPDNLVALFSSFSSCSARTGWPALAIVPFVKAQDQVEAAGRAKKDAESFFFICLTDPQLEASNLEKAE
mmetsp:Transcript_4337/g.8663  ORF Transcript_4337/g.8663 Transcript_4337/m.8663 type:complete len:97 (+) Transcript_4337:18-308(+)